MTCSTTWVALGKRWLNRQSNGRKTYTSPCRLHDRRCSNCMVRSLQWPVCFPFQRISLILSGSSDHLESGTRRWILILRTRHLILPNTRRPFWSLWRMNTAPNTDKCPSLNPKNFQHTKFCLLCKGFWVWSIVFWSIWFIHPLWQMLHA